MTVIEGPRSDALGQALLYGVGLNEQGHVVGYFHYTGGWNRPFLWTDETGLVELPLPPDSYEAWAGDINEAGQIVGSMTHNDLGFRGFLYEDGEYTVVGPVIPDAGWSSSSAINNDGRVVGYRSITEEVNPYNAYIWSAEDGFTDLGVMEGPYSAARDISETGLVVGWTGYPTPADEAFLWDDGELTILGPIPGGISSSARSVNNRGEIVGNSATEVGRSSELRGLGFMWHEGDWTLLQPIAGYDESGAAAINDLSQIVGSSGPIGPGGSHPTLWQNEQPWDLNDLANVEHGFTMEACDDINNRGQIIAEGYDAQYISVTFLLTPIGRPTGDITGDCNVGVADLLFLLAEWGKTDSPADINDDGVVGVWDLLALLGDWGS
ncbi:MAG: hypothetical protein SYC29_06650 [Planctomycetota bacterium]|nr:hypothetical protein [Planctomycetota bacterium]